MSPARFDEITARYRQLRVILLGDFCLDRYLEIDPARAEVSIETGLPVNNVVRVRSQPGGAGTILNNLVALGIGHVHALGFCGDDGEGYELQRALSRLPGVKLDHFLCTPKRRTFTYCKPLRMHPDRPPEELERLDSKNWDPTPADIEEHVVGSLDRLAANADAVIVLDQVDAPDTGVVTRGVRQALERLAAARPDLLLLADSRQGLAGWPPIGLKMNAAELAALLGQPEPPDRQGVMTLAGDLARRNGRHVIVTLSADGVVGALADGTVEWVPSQPVRGPIDIVGAGDSVTANLAAALAARASLREALEVCMAAASIVIHQLGTTGTASLTQLRERLVA